MNMNMIMSNIIIITVILFIMLIFMSTVISSRCPVHAEGHHVVVRQEPCTHGAVHGLFALVLFFDSEESFGPDGISLCGALEAGGP